MSETPHTRITLRPGTWYGWQMLPGYSDVPYVSPILVHDVKPLKTGRGVFELDFLNLFYAQGVQRMGYRLRTYCRRPTYLLADVESKKGRAVMVCTLTAGWLELFCPFLLEEFGGGPGPRDPQRFMAHHLATSRTEGRW